MWKDVHEWLPCPSTYLTSMTIPYNIWHIVVVFFLCPKGKNRQICIGFGNSWFELGTNLRVTITISMTFLAVFKIKFICLQIIQPWYMISTFFMILFEVWTYHRNQSHNTINHLLILVYFLLSICGNMSASHMTLIIT